MEIIKFKLSGKTAFFKKPEVNTYYYFTYGQIHKPALLGIFGAMLGYRGYGNVLSGNDGSISFGKKGELPEYYQKLQKLSVGIEPCNKNGYIPKKVQIFNNSVGYASAELGGNLIVKEQWLESPEWNIYLLNDNEESQKLKHAINNQSVIYPPYLGKNDHPADISGITMYHGEKMQEGCRKCSRIDSLFFREHAELDFDDEDMEERIFKYEESLPVGLKKDSLLYQLKKLVYTNVPVTCYDAQLYEIKENGKMIAFL